jgi:hypothetical protein
MSAAAAIPANTATIHPPERRLNVVPSRSATLLPEPCVSITAFRPTHRFRRLHSVDQLAAHLERRAAVGRTDRDNDGKITDLEVTDAVNRRDADDIRPCCQPLGDIAQDLRRARVTGVVKSLDAVAMVELAHDADERGNTAGPRVPHGLNDLIDRQRRLTDVGKHHLGHDQ